METAPIDTLPLLPQIDWLLPALAAGTGFTVITADPEPEFEHEFPSVTFVSVYVVVEVGLTLIEAGLLLILFTVVEVVPLLYVTLQGDLPVRVTEILVDEPLHIVPEPDNDAVGLPLTLTTSEPLPVLEQLLLSLTLVTV